MRERILALAMVLALVGVMVMPTAALAAAGEVTGSVTSNNNAPAITSVLLQASGGGATISAMTPQLEAGYLLQIIATDDNLIDDIATIDIWVYHDTTAGPGDPPAAWDADDCAIYKWTKGAGTPWTMENSGYTTTWAVTTASCITPSAGEMTTATSGTWKLSFKPGKLAVKTTVSDTDEWNFKVTVKDAANASATNQLEVLNSMATYVELTLDESSIVFGGAGIALGATAYITTPADFKFASAVLANYQHILKINTTSTWTGGMTLDADGTPTNAGSFSLTIDDATTGGVGQPTTAQPLTATAANITGHETDALVTVAASANEAARSVDWFMGIILNATGIPVGAHNGTITFTIQ